jgi:hypothetical protein
MFDTNINIIGARNGRSELCPISNALDKIEDTIKEEENINCVQRFAGNE